MKQKIDSLTDSQLAVSQILKDHRENFARFTWFIPASVRQDLYTLYAFCRIADDAADDPGSKISRLALLDSIQSSLENSLQNREPHSFYPSLAEMIQRRKMPTEEFYRLLNAFRWDQTTTDWQSMERLERYCEGSANPVGRLVLHIFYSPETAMQYYPASDSICTALQLVNFWQDVHRDYESGRIYLPYDTRTKYGVTNEILKSGKATDGYRSLLKELCDDTENRFQVGRSGFRKLRGADGFTIDWFATCGLKLVDNIRALNYDTLTTRPTVSKLNRVSAAFTSLFRRNAR